MILIIKGNRAAALLAALAHGAEPGSIKTISEPSQEESGLLAGDKYAPRGGVGAVVVPVGSCTLEAEIPWESLSRWFCEAPHEPPFPVGSLLWFRGTGAN